MAAPRSVAQCINGGLGWLEGECKRCKTRASLPLNAIRRPRNMPIWKLEAALVASWIGPRKRTKRKQAQAGSCKLNARLVSPLWTSKLPTWRRNDFALLVGRSQLRNAPLFDLFKSPPYHDFLRSETDALARPLTAFASWRPAIERALFETTSLTLKRSPGVSFRRPATPYPKLQFQPTFGSCVVSLCIRHAVGRRAHYRIWIHHRLGRGAHAWSSFPVRKVHRTVRQRFASVKATLVGLRRAEQAAAFGGTSRSRRMVPKARLDRFLGQLCWVRLGEQCSRSCFSPVGSRSCWSVPVSRCECFATVHFGLAAID